MEKQNNFIVNTRLDTSDSAIFRNKPDRKKLKQKKAFNFTNYSLNK